MHANAIRLVDEVFDVRPGPFRVIDNEDNPEVRKSGVELVVEEINEAAGIERRPVHKVAAGVWKLEDKGVIDAAVFAVDDWKVWSGSGTAPASGNDKE